MPPNMQTLTPGSSDTIPVTFRWLSAPASAVAFYAAIALPAGYLPLLLIGITTMDGLLLFLGLVALHVVALLGGRFHDPVAG